MADYPTDPMDRNPHAQRLLARIARLETALRTATGQRRIEALQGVTSAERELDRIAVEIANKPQPRKNAA